ncbi:MAG: glycosyltransferase family 2 protein [Pseudomonadota bacterium]
MDEAPALSVVIPCYNEEAVLDELRRRLVPVCEDQVGQDFEIVLVNDGSRDATAEILRRFHEEDPRFVAVLLSRNHGHQLALSAGLAACRGARILILDADLQDPPELLSQMWTEMDAGADVVYGKRAERQGETWFKKASAAAFYRLLDAMTDVKIPLDTGDFRLMSRKALDVLLAMPEQHRFIRGMVAWLGFRQVAVSYTRHERFAGETKYPLRKMVLFAIDALTAFSVVPLRMATWLGFAGAFLAVPFALYTLVGWASGNNVSGWTSLMLVVLVMGSIQLVVIGILGEYLGRLYVQSKNRPLFVVDEVLRAPEQKE